MALGTLPFPLYVAARYLRSARRDAYVTFLSAVAIVGLGLGVASLILALAAIAGFQEALKGEVLARTPQLEIELPPGMEAGAAATLEASLASLPEVSRVARVVRGRAWLLSGRTVLPVELVGSSAGTPAWFPGAPVAPSGLITSETTAARLGLVPGLPVTVVSPRPGLTPMGPQPRSQAVAFAGTYTAGKSDPEERAAVPFEIAASLLGRTRQRMEVETGGLDAALRVAERARHLLPPGARVSTWRELNRPLFFALRLERSVMFVAVALIIVVAALALVSDLSLLIANKKTEIGTLGALGASPEALRDVFASLGAAIAGLGIGAGALLGIGAAMILDRTRGLTLPGGGFFLDYVPFRVEALDVSLVVVLAALLSWGFSRSAARGAARLRPVEAMRG